MSMFLPEGVNPQSGIVDVTPAASPQTPGEDSALMKRVLGAAAAQPNAIPDGFMAYIVDYIQTSNLTIPIGQIFGSANKFNATIDTAVTQSVTAALAAMFKAQVAASETEVNITSATFATFTGAPSLSALADGHYFVLWGTSGNGDSAAGGSTLQIAVRPNGSGNTNYAETTVQSSHMSIARGDVVALSAGGTSNTLALVALTSIAGHTSVVRHSWLMALKYADL